MPQEIMIVALSALGPVIGSGIGVWKRPTASYFHNMLYFAAGIMLAISFLDLIPESRHLGSTLTCVAGLAIGAAAMWTLDRVFHPVHECSVCGENEGHMGHTANFLILAIFLHNFPEGICTSAPHYYAYGSRLKSFMMSSLSALPIVAGYFVARHLFVQIAPETMSVLVGATAGLMIYISTDELMPAAQDNRGGQTIFFFMVGIVSVMLLELIV